MAWFVINQLSILLFLLPVNLVAPVDGKAICPISVPVIYRHPQDRKNDFASGLEVRRRVVQ